MAENTYQLNWWPRADDRLDPMFAMGTSVMLHLGVLLLLLLGGIGSGAPARSGSQGSSHAPLSALAASEFRQRLVLASIPGKSKQTPTAGEAKPEPLPSGETSLAMPRSEQSLDVRVEPSTLQAQIAESTLQRSVRDVARSPKKVGSPSMSQAQNIGAYSESGGSSSDSLRTAYLAELRNAIQEKWSINPNHHGSCSITVRQSIGGNVASSITSDCQLDEVDRMALEAAALMAQPLPYAGFESVFSEDITLEIDN